MDPSSSSESQAQSEPLCPQTIEELLSLDLMDIPEITISGCELPVEPIDSIIEVSSAAAPCPCQSTSIQAEDQGTHPLQISDSYQFNLGLEMETAVAGPSSSSIPWNFQDSALVEMDSQSLPHNQNQQSIDKFWSNSPVLDIESFVLPISGETDLLISPTIKPKRSEIAMNPKNNKMEFIYPCVEPFGYLRENKIRSLIWKKSRALGRQRTRHPNEPPIPEISGEKLSMNYEKLLTEQLRSRTEVHAPSAQKRSFLMEDLLKKESETGENLEKINVIRLANGLGFKVFQPSKSDSPIFFSKPKVELIHWTPQELELLSRTLRRGPPPPPIPLRDNPLFQARLKKAKANLAKFADKEDSNSKAFAKSIIPPPIKFTKGESSVERAIRLAKERNKERLEKHAKKLCTTSTSNAETTMSPTAGTSKKRSKNSVLGEKSKIAAASPISDVPLINSSKESGFSFTSAVFKVPENPIRIPTTSASSTSQNLNKAGPASSKTKVKIPDILVTKSASKAPISKISQPSPLPKPLKRKNTESIVASSSLENLPISKQSKDNNNTKVLGKSGVSSSSTSASKSSSESFTKFWETSQTKIKSFDLFDASSIPTPMKKSNMTKFISTKASSSSIQDKDKVQKNKSRLTKEKVDSMTPKLPIHNPIEQILETLTQKLNPKVTNKEPKILKLPKENSQSKAVKPIKQKMNLKLVEQEQPKVQTSLELPNPTSFSLPVFSKLTGIPKSLVQFQANDNLVSLSLNQPNSIPQFPESLNPIVFATSENPTKSNSESQNEKFQPIIPIVSRQENPEQVQQISEEFDENDPDILEFDLGDDMFSEFDC